MSLVHSDPKYPTSTPSGLPPSPSRENPGQVFPASDPNAAPIASAPGSGGYVQPKSDIGNPFLLASVLDKVDSALGDAIAILEREGATVSSEGDNDPLLERFVGWRAEIDRMRGVPGVTERERSRSGSRPRAPQGGLFAD